MSHALRLLEGRFSVCRLPPDAAPKQPEGGGFLSITRTEDELSIVCPRGHEPDGAEIEPGWRALKVRGPLDFSEIGVLASLAEPLAGAGVSIFVISTYDTDYVLVRDRDLERARSALTAAGHMVSLDRATLGL